MNLINQKNRLVTIIVLILISYGFFNARNIIMGPKIEILSPSSDKIDTKENLIKIKGRVQNIVSLNLNERSISVDLQGFFEEKLVLYPGTNIVELKAKDRFNKETKKEIEIYYSENEKQGTTTNISLLNI